MSTEKHLFTNNIGVTFRVFGNVDLATATAVSFEVKKPNGQLVNWVATVDSSNTFYATYSTVSGDLDKPGEYLLSLQATFAGGMTVTGRSAKFFADDQFKDVIV